MKLRQNLLWSLIFLCSCVAFASDEIDTQLERLAREYGGQIGISALDFKPALSH